MLSSRKLVIWGAGGHAKVVADIISLRGEYAIAAFLEDAPSGSSPGSFLGVPVYYGLDGLDRAGEEHRQRQPYLRSTHTRNCPPCSFIMMRSLVIDLVDRVRRGLLIVRSRPAARPHVATCGAPDSPREAA